MNCLLKNESARTARSGRRRRLGIVAAMLAVAALTMPLLGQVSTTQPGTTPTTVGRANGSTTAPTTGPRGVTETGAGLILNFQDASIDTVLNELSASAGFIVVKEVKPEGRVTLVSRQPVPPDEAVALLNTVLRNAGYVAIQQERILKIVSRDSAKRLNIPVRTGNDPAQIAKTDELITQVIPLRYADATALKTDLQALINPDADFTSNASSNALILTDTSANVRRLVEIVRALDTSMADSIDVKVFQLKFANATTAATLINEVFQNLNPSGGESGGGGNNRGGGGGNNRGGGGNGGGGGGNNGDPRERFRQFFQQQQGGGGGGNNSGSAAKAKTINAGADERTNSLVVTGPPDSLKIVAEVIKELDANPAAEETTFVYRLRNAQAIDIESTLNGLFNGTAPTNRSTLSNADILRQNRSSSLSSSSGGGRAGGTGNTTGANRGGGFQGGGFAGGGQGVSGATQKLANDLAGQVNLVADVDSNSLLIRTSPTNYERVKAILDDMDRPVAQVLIKVLIAEVTHDSSFDYGAELSVLNLRTNAAGVTTGGQSGGTNFNIPKTGTNATGLVVQLLENNFTATIRALETAGKLDVLSRPYILASDNQLASITVGQSVPFITASRTTDLGGTNNTIEYKDIGILLDVIPHINPDGLVILDVAPEISTLTSGTVRFSADAVAPIINKRSALTHVGVRSGSTIVIGGLMEDRLTETVNKVPLLGDIPGLGALFRSHQKSKTKTELLIFLTPHVAVSPDVLDGMSNDELKGTKLVPHAVEPGMYDEHIEGLRRGDADHPVGGGPTTIPAAEPEPIPLPDLQPARPANE